MNRISKNTTADLYFQINWSSKEVRHTESYAAHRVNFWRDILPAPLHEGLTGKQSGDMVRVDLPAEVLLQDGRTQDIRTIQNRQFDGTRISHDKLLPRLGRFYPKGVLADIPGIFKANREPFRCIDVNNGLLDIAMGHPLAGKKMKVNVTVGSIYSKLEERGGSLCDWGESIARGIGMQARWEEKPTDFFSDSPFDRRVETPDSEFYAKPRLVQHIDDTAIDMLRQIYARFLRDDAKVLDLMSSWQSHLPDTGHRFHVTGLGLNEVELQHNGRLDGYVLQDLNIDPRLPFDDNTFDVVLCSLSVEYLTAPQQIFNETARILKPGGYFVTSFSNRWFDPKVIRIWPELHDFERMGLVLEYFRNKDLFDDLHTYSVRGLPRPAGDKYYGELPCSDPIYAVWGRSKTQGIDPHGQGRFA